MQVFDKNWFLEKQKPLLWFANTSYGKGLLGHGLKKVDLILPHAVFQKENGKIKAEFRTHNKYAKRLYYEFKPFWKAMHWFDENIANTHVPRLNLGFDTLTAYPAADANAPMDGYVARTATNQTFSAIRAGGGDTSSATDANNAGGYLRASTTSNQFSHLYRSIYCFDTSSLGAGSTINSAVFSLYGRDKGSGLGTPGLDIVASTPASTTNIANSDYGQLGTTSFGTVSYASFSLVGYNNFTLDTNGVANIDKSTANNTKFGATLTWDTSGTFGGSWSSTATAYVFGYFADQTGTSNDPKLVVTYTSGNAIFFGTNF